ncbi:MAG: serine protein kinase PrkA [bacterium]|nr:serine protein kinase PrkA [bacterium]
MSTNSKTKSKDNKADKKIEQDIIKNAVEDLNQNINAHPQRQPITFNEFLGLVADNPQGNIRNVFQVFHDMIDGYVGEGFEEYPDDPEAIGFVFYDCYPLLGEDTDRPFFADRLFANRLINLAKALRKGAQQNKIYIFEGPPGCGKSTFLNNLLMKFEKYANTPEGTRYETVWRLKRESLGVSLENQSIPYLEKISHGLNNGSPDQDPVFGRQSFIRETEDYVEIPCPCHDNPLLLIPKNYRRDFFDNLFKNSEFKYKLFTEKQYEWIFSDSPCTICSSIYKALQPKLDHPSEVFDMVYAGQYYFNRRLGEGVSVFNPGDKPLRHNVFTNEMLQYRLDSLLKDSNRVRYIFSNYAKTNNGIYALMDIKSHNKDRLIELHNIISEGIHKVEHIEENVHSLFLALMNPEDKRNISNIHSFVDRIEYIKVPYILDLQTEVEIYRNVFGKHIDAAFLPKVLHNFARVIIASRLNKRSEALLEWINVPEKYDHYCDRNLHLLKMEVYTGRIPTWLEEDDLKRFTARLRKKIIAESEFEGNKGFSGRDSIKIFNDFYSAYVNKDKPITMDMLKGFFKKKQKEQPGYIPDGFVDSLCRMYDYNVLQEVKESLYYYNEEIISSDIQDYLYAVNFEMGSEIRCIYTRRQFTVDADFFDRIEQQLLGEGIEQKVREDFRHGAQKEYAGRTLTQEIMSDGRDIKNTDLYLSLMGRYLYNLKQKVLEPFLKNENFRRAIKDFDKESFKTYDRKIQDDVTYLIDNLQKRYKYSMAGAKEVCIYVVDNELAHKYSKS